MMEEDEKQRENTNRQRRWQDLFGDYISDPLRLKRLCNDTQFSATTFQRWVKEETTPRSASIRLLLQHLPEGERSSFQTAFQTAGLLLEEKELEPSKNSSSPLEIHLDTIPVSFYARVLAARQGTSASNFSWTIVQLVLQQCRDQLDSRQGNLFLSVLLCTTPEPGKPIRSLREQAYLNAREIQKPSFPPQVVLGTRFLLGAESLLSQACSSPFYPAFQLLSEEEEETFLGVQSLGAIPFLFQGKFAGCLLLLSRRADFFENPLIVRLVTEYASLLSLAFEEDQFYHPDQLDLALLPSRLQQFSLIKSLQQRKILLQQQMLPSRLKSHQAELAAWRQIEEACIELAQQHFSTDR